MKMQFLKMHHFACNLKIQIFLFFQTAIFFKNALLACKIIGPSFVHLNIYDKSVIFRYHVPRSWLNPSGNLLVVFDEWGGDATGISLVKRTTGSVCADIFEGQPTLKNWDMLNSGKVNRPKAHLWCPPGQKISQIKFASYGLPQGTCGSFREGSCHAHKSYDAAQKVSEQF